MLAEVGWDISTEYVRDIYTTDQRQNIVNSGQK